MQADTGFGLGTGEVKRRHILPKALLVGLVAGLLASGFRLALAAVEAQRLEVLTSMEARRRIPLAMLVGMLGGAASVWLVRRFSPDASGSGIPQIKAFMLGEGGLQWRRLLPTKFLAGVAG